jgi:hypothetical protein
MLLQSVASSIRIPFLLTVLIPVLCGVANAAPTRHPRPWPIHNWHQFQPRETQLKAMHIQDITPREARKVNRLYWELEGQTVNGAVDCDTNIIPLKQRNQCRAEAGTRVLPSRPVPRIMAPSR